MNENDACYLCTPGKYCTTVCMCNKCILKSNCPGSDPDLCIYDDNGKLKE
jgi:hypothetical protein